MIAVGGVALPDVTVWLVLCAAARPFLRAVEPERVRVELLFVELEIKRIVHRHGLAPPALLIVAGRACLKRIEFIFALRAGDERDTTVGVVAKSLDCKGICHTGIRLTEKNSVYLESGARTDLHGMVSLHEGESAARRLVECTPAEVIEPMTRCCSPGHGAAPAASPRRRIMIRGDLR